LLVASIYTTTMTRKLFKVTINIASMSRVNLFLMNEKRFDLTVVVGKLLAPLLLVVFALAHHSYCLVAAAIEICGVCNLVAATGTGARS
jgi:uncharacterized membrane protein